MLVIVLISWVFFAIEDMSVCGRYLSTMFGFGGVPFADERFVYLFLTNAVILVILIFASIPTLPYLKNKLMPKYGTVFETLAIPASLIVWFLVTASLVSGSYNPFLYFRF